MKDVHQVQLGDREMEVACKVVHTFSAGHLVQVEW